jgi:hypothetical protein
LKHPHCQLIATPVVPRLVRLKQQIAADYYDLMGRCLYSVLRDEELAAEKRVLTSNSEFAAVLPFASHVPFEVWILPKVQQASFGSVDRCGAVWPNPQDMLLKLFVGLDNPDFNRVDTVPRGRRSEYFCGTSRSVAPDDSAGFELGSGMSINTVLPKRQNTFATPGLVTESKDRQITISAPIRRDALHRPGDARPRAAGPFGADRRGNGVPLTSAARDDCLYMAVTTITTVATVRSSAGTGRAFVIGFLGLSGLVSYNYFRSDS